VEGSDGVVEGERRLRPRRVAWAQNNRVAGPLLACDRPIGGGVSVPTRPPGDVWAGAEQFAAPGELPLRVAPETPAPIDRPRQRPPPPDHGPPPARAQVVRRDGVSPARAGKESGAHEQPRGGRAAALQPRQGAPTVQGQMILVLDVPPPRVPEEALERARIGPSQARQHRVLLQRQQPAPCPDPRMALAGEAGGCRDARIDPCQRVRARSDGRTQGLDPPPSRPAAPLARPGPTIPQSARRLRRGQPVLPPQPHHFPTFSSTTCQSGHNGDRRIRSNSRGYPRPRPSRRPVARALPADVTRPVTALRHLTTSPRATELFSGCTLIVIDPRCGWIIPSTR
jgi:hypothetical protein